MLDFLKIFETHHENFQEFAQNNPTYLWTNTVSEGVLAVAYLVTAIAVFVAARKRDGSIRLTANVFCLFLLFTGLTRFFVVLAPWAQMYRALIITKGFSAAFCVVSSLILIPNLRRLMQLKVMEASHQIRLALERESELRTKSERTLRFYEEMVENSSQAVVAFCLERNIIFYANPEFAKLSHFSLDELIGQPFDLIALPPDEHAEAVRALSASLRDNKIWRTEMQAKRKDGSRFWCEVALKPISHPEHGQVLLSTATDISARKAAEKKILEQQVQIANSAKLAALGEMAAGIGHEINNPLASILANVEDTIDLLSANAISQTQVIERLTRIESTGIRIAKIVRGLRTFARKESPLERRRQRVQDIVLDTLGFCSERFQNNGIALRIQDIPEDLHIDCLPGQISQVLLNLLNNSFDAVVDLPEKWVEVSATHKEGVVEIRVTDSGHGIASTVRSRIMQPFFTTKDPGKGSGLGLSISRGIIENHRGTLELNEAAPHTQFVILLPHCA